MNEREELLIVSLHRGLILVGKENVCLCLSYRQAPVACTREGEQRETEGEAARLILLCRSAQVGSIPFDE